MEDKNNNQETNEKLGIKLIEAIKNGKSHKDLKKLINLKANINFQEPDFQVTPLFCATEKSYYYTVKFLLKSNANPNLGSGTDKSTPLRIAFEKHCYGFSLHYYEIAELLIHYGANIYQDDQNGKCELSWYEDHPAIAKLLNKAKEKADLDLIIEAIKNNKMNIAKEILSKNVNLRDYKGNNILHIAAAQYGSPKIFYYIWILAPKLFNEENKKGKIAIDLNPEIILHLINLGLIKKHNEEEQVKKKLKLN